MDAGLYIYFPWDPGHNIYFKVFDSQAIYFFRNRGLAVYVELEYLLRATIFIFIQLQQRPFILRYSLFKSDGCRFIYIFSLGPRP